ncbi:MAG: DUF3471 domain-containing protein, partial [Pseudomonadota bacterium]|nr:DUF3471 domain-containing protein [Pseudomonadota bacterium]
EVEQPKKIQKALPLSAYATRYNDNWYGDIVIAEQNGKLTIDFTHSARLKGTLEHFNGNTFIVRWQEKLLEADAFVEFEMSPTNQVRSAKMHAVAPSVTDFSFDFHNLHLTPVKSDKS